jgi:hypothetical protein
MDVQQLCWAQALELMDVCDSELEWWQCGVFRRQQA